MSEQHIIEKYFSRHTVGENIDVSVGDDAAIVRPVNDTRLVITTDTLNQGIHFFPDCNAEQLGHKCLAVSLSDLASMGSKPLWATLNLSLPEINHTWLDEFSNGLYSLADRYAIKIIGGDLTRGPLSITTQAIGSLPEKSALTRSSAEVGDLIYVSGTLGDAMLATFMHQSNINIICSEAEQHQLNKKLNQPEPRVDLGVNILSIAKACIDISDGLLIDLQRIMSASNVGALLYLDKIPYSATTKKYLNETNQWWLPLTHGDDYELLFTIANDKQEQIEKIIQKYGFKISCIGKIKKEQGLTILNNGKNVSSPNKLGFDHFDTNNETL